MLEKILSFRSWFWWILRKPMINSTIFPKFKGWNILDRKIEIVDGLKYYLEKSEKENKEIRTTLKAFLKVEEGTSPFEWWSKKKSR